MPHDPIDVILHALAMAALVLLIYIDSAVVWFNASVLFWFTREMLQARDKGQDEWWYPPSWSDQKKWEAFVVVPIAAAIFLI